MIHAEASSKGELTKNAKRLGLAGDARKFSRDLDRAQLMQLLFLFDDDTLVGFLDECVRSRSIEIPEGEVRVPKVNAAVRTGAWRLRSEVNHLGVRAVGLDGALPLMRLSALARSMFSVDSNDDMDDLAWVLRGTPGLTPKDQLEEFLRVTDPVIVVEKLILYRRISAERACAALGVPLDQPQNELRNALLWKLGLRVKPSQDIRDDYWALHSGLEALAKSAQVDISTTAEGLRATSSDYFVALEKFLFDSLVFATWALLHDHYGSQLPFVFIAEDARSFAIETLNSSSEMPENDRDALSDKPQLAQLVANFTRLSKALAELRADGGSNLRPKTQWPQFQPKTDLQKFPFEHTRPFLDLMPDAQVRIIDTLSAVASGLGDSGIMKARNGLLHASQDVPTVAELTESLYTRSNRP